MAQDIHIFQRTKQMRAVPHIFLDTTALKYAVDERLVLAPEETIVHWGNHEVRSVVYKPQFQFPNGKLLQDGNVRQFRETLLLPCLASFAKKEFIKFLCHPEVECELLWLPRTADPRGRFYGAPIERASDPFPYRRILVDASGKIDHQYEFLARIKERRFLELQRATGAFQGNDRPFNRNQLLDAWHLYCAEHVRADFFLTLDIRLQRVTRTSKRYAPRVEIVTPEALVRTLVTARPRLLWSFLREATLLVWRYRIRPRSAEKEFFLGTAS